MRVRHRHAYAALAEPRVRCVTAAAGQIISAMADPLELEIVNPQPGQIVRARVGRCETCSEIFLAGRTRKHCSPRCRTAAWRKRLHERDESTDGQ